MRTHYSLGVNVNKHGEPCLDGTVTIPHALGADSVSSFTGNYGYGGSMSLDFRWMHPRFVRKLYPCFADVVIHQLDDNRSFVSCAQKSSGVNLWTRFGRHSLGVTAMLRDNLPLLDCQPVASTSVMRQPLRDLKVGVGYAAGFVSSNVRVDNVLGLLSRGVSGVFAVEASHILGESSFVKALVKAEYATELGTVKRLYGHKSGSSGKLKSGNLKSDGGTSDGGSSVSGRFILRLGGFAGCIVPLSATRSSSSRQSDSIPVSDRFYLGGAMNAMSGQASIGSFTDPSSGQGTSSGQGATGQSLVSAGSVPAESLPAAYGPQSAILPQWTALPLLGYASRGVGPNSSPVSVAGVDSEANSAYRKGDFTGGNQIIGGLARIELHMTQSHSTQSGLNQNHLTQSGLNSASGESEGPFRWIPFLGANFGSISKDFSFTRLPSLESLRMSVGVGVKLVLNPQANVDLAFTVPVNVSRLTGAAETSQSADLVQRIQLGLQISGSL